MDVEEMAETDPSALVKRHIEPGEEFTAQVARGIAIDARIDEDVTDQVAELLVKLHDAALAEDATLIEINPVIVTSDREVVALDSKMTIDNSAIYRHEEMADLRDPSAEDPQEQMAKEKGLTYVKLGGNIGILGNGAGLCMSTLDVVAQAGASRRTSSTPAGLEGGRDRRRARGDHLDENVNAILFNIFGGSRAATRSPRGSSRLREIELDMPMVVRLDGTNSEEGLARSRRPSSDLHLEKTMLGAAERVVEIASG
jgi:succinyl-CoA synthetase beta subunit